MTPQHLRQVAARTALDGFAEALKEGASTIETLAATIARRDAVIKLLEGEVTDAHDRNAALVAVLSRARAFIHLDRQSLADCSMRPDNTMETDDAEAVAIYDAMLHEVDAAIAAQAKEGGEPFGYFRAEPFGWTDCAETDEGAIALYEHPPASLEQAQQAASRLEIAADRAEVAKVLRRVSRALDVSTDDRTILCHAAAMVELDGQAQQPKQQPMTDEVMLKAKRYDWLREVGGQSWHDVTNPKKPIRAKGAMYDAAVDDALQARAILTQQPDNTTCKSVQKRLEAQQPATGEPVVDVRCEGCGYMTHHREHMGCVRAAKQHTHPAPSVPGDDFDLICNAIDKADTITMAGDYMLDSDDCIAVVRVMQVLLSVRAAMLAAK